MILSKKLLDCSLEDNEQAFSIKQKDMGIILEILRSKLYSDPIGSICREIACNARDANREVGKFNTPIEISFIKLFEDDDSIYVTFKDEGPGISPDRISDVFINYGSSTKRNDNIQTGGFGIGAKVPFSYTDNFYIITVVDNIKYIYRAIISNNNGSLFLHSKHDTNEINGTTISIPIKETDREKFEKCIYYYTFLWNIKPIYNNFIEPIYNINIFHENENGSVIEYSNLFDSNSVYANIDGILYKTNLKLAASYSNTNSVAILNYNIGDLTISANRETLHFDEKTENKLKSDYDNYVNDLYGYIINSLHNCSNLSEAITCYNSSKYSSLISICTYYSYSTYNYVDINLDSYNYLKFNYINIVYNNHRKKRYLSSFKKEHDYSTLYIKTIKTKNIFREQYLMQKHSNGYISIEFKDEYILNWKKFNYKTKKNYVTTLRGIINDINTLKSYGFNVMLYNDIKIPKNEKDIIKSKNNNIKKIKVTIKGVNHIKSIESLTFKNNLYYSTKTNKYDVYLSMIYGKQLIIISESHIDLVKDKMESYDQLLERTDKKLFNDISTYNYIQTNTEYNLSKYNNINFNIDLRNAINYIIVMRDKINSNLPNLHYNISKEFIDEYPPDNKVIESINIIKKYFNEYKMFKLFNWYNLETDELTIVNDYVKLIDERNEKSCRTYHQI